METKIVLGFVDGKPVEWNFRELPHLLIGGSSGSGKSMLIEFIESQAKDFSCSVLRDLQTKDEEYSLDWLEKHEKELADRRKKLIETNSKRIEEYNSKVSDEEKLPYVVMIVDGLDNLMLSKNELAYRIEKIIATCRCLGYTVVTSVQFHIPTKIRLNCAVRMCGKVNEREQSKAIIGTTTAFDERVKTGQFVIGGLADDEIIVQIPDLSKESA